MRSSQTFRDMLRQPGLVMIPGCYDCITAIMVERAGFPAVYLTGSGIFLSLLGQPDLNTVSYLEMLQTVQNIRSAVRIPMVVDIDTGYGAPLNLIRLIWDFDALDVAAVQIEDQCMPKKCGHEMGRKLVSAGEMVSRIRTIRDNRREDGTVIIARTDARTTYGVEEAISRANRYIEAGAELVFIESPESYGEVKRIVSEVAGPVVFNNVEGGRSPSLSRAELEDAGVKVTIYPNAQTRVVTKMCGEMLRDLQSTGTTAGHLKNMLTHRDLFALFHHDEWVALENRYTYHGEQTCGM